MFLEEKYFDSIITNGLILRKKENVSKSIIKKLIGKFKQEY